MKNVNLDRNEAVFAALETKEGCLKAAPLSQLQRDATFLIMMTKRHGTKLSRKCKTKDFHQVWMKAKEVTIL